MVSPTPVSGVTFDNPKFNDQAHIFTFIIVLIDDAVLGQMVAFWI